MRKGLFAVLMLAIVMVPVQIFAGNYAQGKNGVVAAPDETSCKAALDMLRNGGNAVDAAIACALTAGVSQPQTSGVGGGGYAIVYIAKENKCYFLDYQHVAPHKATQEAYKYDEKGNAIDNANNVGYRSVAIPGQMRGLDALHRKFGTKPWKDLFSSAIAAARDGYKVSPFLAPFLKDIPRSFPKSQFLKWAMTSYFHDGKALEAGEIAKNPDLINTLEILRDGGADEFYTGKIAAKIVAQYKANNDDWITSEDLAGYKPQWLEPLTFNYRNCKVMTAPPPGYGGVAIAEYMKIVEQFNINKSPRADAVTTYILSEAMKRSWADVYKYVGDPKFIDNPLNDLLSENHARKLSKEIADGPIEGVRPLVINAGCTTTFSIADKDGNMVSITQTLAGVFGSAVVIDGTGIIMNDKMGDFKLQQKDHVNYIMPGKAAPTAMAPTFVFKNGKPFMSLGSAGSDRIPGAIAQVIFNSADYAFDLKTAIEYSRLNNQNSPVTQYEGGILDNGVKQLEAKGLKYKRWDPPINTYFAGTQAVMLTDDGVYAACGDPRRSGEAGAVE